MSVNPCYRATEASHVVSGKDTLRHAISHIEDRMRAGSITYLDGSLTCKRMYEILSLPEVTTTYSHSKDSLFTPTEKIKMEKVKSDLENGKNPFSHHTDTLNKLTTEVKKKIKRAKRKVVKTATRIYRDTSRRITKKLVNPLPVGSKRCPLCDSNVEVIHALYVKYIVECLTRTIQPYIVGCTSHTGSKYDPDKAATKLVRYPIYKRAYIHSACYDPLKDQVIHYEYVNKNGELVERDHKVCEILCRPDDAPRDSVRSRVEHSPFNKIVVEDAKVKRVSKVELGPGGVIKRQWKSKLDKPTPETVDASAMAAILKPTDHKKARDLGGIVRSKKANRVRLIADHEQEHGEVYTYKPIEIEAENAIRGLKPAK
jgi:hypothetical protein